VERASQTKETSEALQGDLETYFSTPR
jgi:hypothetical protein